MTTANGLPAQTNKHYLQGLINLSHSREVEVAEDIYSHNGMKLIARGTRVTPELYDRVVHHKLARPIETTVVARDAPDAAAFARLGEQLMDEIPFLRGIAGWQNAPVSALGMLSQMRFNPAASTLLMVAQQRMPDMLRHDVMVAMLAMGLAQASRPGDQQTLSAACMAGLFHDIGEAYIDPALLRKGGRKLDPREWMSYTSHPIIGAALAREIAGLDAAVQMGVLEHHERLDGFGYPRNLVGAKVSIAGRLISLAETLSALVEKPAAGRRMDVALKIMPGEYEPALVNALWELIAGVSGEHVEHAPADDVQAFIHEVFRRIANVLFAYEELSALGIQLSRDARTALDEVFGRFIKVQRAFTSTGVAELAAVEGGLSEAELAEIRFEVNCVLDEIAWRLMKLSRELAMKCMTLPEPDSSLLMRLSAAMSGIDAEPDAQAA